jgi:hypothetical protein
MDAARGKVMTAENGEFYRVRVATIWSVQNRSRGAPDP